MKLLSDIYSLIQKEGYTIGNVDATIIAEAPKLLNHIDAMRQNIATVLSCDLSQVSVKATTHERLGALGKKKGIAAHSVALIIKK
jgi:2-C-methyl-D-erythritol 2,4-cyclodiphosphate synthase